jgi:hypothetical protein
MRRLLGSSRWFLAAVPFLALGGCVTNQQFFDFTRTEFARVIADTFGRVFQVYVQATA